MRKLGHIGARIFLIFSWWQCSIVFYALMKTLDNWKPRINSCRCQQISLIISSTIFSYLFKIIAPELGSCYCLIFYFVEPSVFQYCMIKTCAQFVFFLSQPNNLLSLFLWKLFSRLLGGPLHVFFCLPSAFQVFGINLNAENIMETTAQQFSFYHFSLWKGSGNAGVSAKLLLWSRGQFANQNNLFDWCE